jgi:hypothetical protein
VVAQARHDFAVLRVAMRNWAKRNIGDGSRAAADAATLAKLLDSYAGEGTGAVTRDFSFIAKPDVKKLVERDYRELTLRAFPDGAWKSTVILAGSILEAVLGPRTAETVAAYLHGAGFGQGSSPNERVNPDAESVPSLR